MNALRRRAWLARLVVLAIAAPAAMAQPREILNALPQLTLGGKSRLTFLGFSVYDASLWVQPGFKAAEYEKYPFALELTYLRDFTNDDITERSITEMRRQTTPTPAQLVSWRELLHNAFPDVQKGDRIAGINRPGEAMLMITNGKVTATIRDEEFARFFFGIWLSVQTSEPRLREALLARVVP